MEEVMPGMFGYDQLDPEYGMLPEEEPKEPEKSCHTCANRCMDMDMDPYCAAVNQPWGQNLARGKPRECGEASLLWAPDLRGLNHLKIL